MWLCFGLFLLKSGQIETAREDDGENAYRHIRLQQQKQAGGGADDAADQAEVRKENTALPVEEAPDLHAAAEHQQGAQGTAAKADGGIRPGHQAAAQRQIHGAGNGHTGLELLEHREISPFFFKKAPRAKALCKRAGIRRFQCTTKPPQKKEAARFLAPNYPLDWFS